MFSKMKPAIISVSVLLCLLACAVMPTVSQEKGPVFQFDKQNSSIKFSVKASVAIKGTFEK